MIHLKERKKKKLKKQNEIYYYRKFLARVSCVCEHPVKKTNLTSDETLKRVRKYIHLYSPAVEMLLGGKVSANLTLGLPHHDKVIHKTILSDAFLFSKKRISTSTNKQKCFEP